MTVSLEGIGISAACPGNVATGVNVVAQGLANYDLVNRGADDALVNILAELVDTAGNRKSDNFTKVIPAGERVSVAHNLGIPAVYDEPGRVDVTMSVEVSGAQSGSHAAECFFIVNAPGG